jgi:hypothetical protein
MVGKTNNITNINCKEKYMIYLYIIIKIRINYKVFPQSLALQHSPICTNNMPIPYANKVKPNK